MVKRGPASCVVLSVLRLTTVAGAVCVVVASFLSGGATRASGVGLLWFVAGALVAAALGPARSRKVRVAAAVLGIATAVAAVVRLVLDVRGGVPGLDTPVLAVGAVGVAVGLLDSTSWRIRPVGLLVAVAMLATAMGAPFAADRVATASTTRGVPDLTPEPVAEKPGGRQWSWQPPADVSAMVAAGHGVVVAAADGSVTALDGLDGSRDWSYARAGAHVHALLASADRRTVVAAFASKTDSSNDLVVVLDADTGTARFDRVVPSVLVETGEILVGTKTLTIRDDAYAGYDIQTGDELWHWSAPAGCVNPYTLPAQARTVVLAALECGRSAGLVALDEVTGHERWRHVVETTGPDDERLAISPATTTDGAVVWLRLVGRAAAPGSVLNGLYDTETGRLLAQPDASRWVRMDVGPIPVTEEEKTSAEALDPGTGTTHPIDLGACPVRSADATTRHTYLRACQDTGRDLTLFVQSFDGSAPTSRVVRMDGSGPLSDLRLVPAPGAIVLARSTYGGTPAPVVGFPG
ncbi:PQQ-binding-like beta-propeller repeat protein [Amycolatopsis sp. DSM 110486]|uniref:outer membrane protein assembly factor BamB family protein n=1 Tax=Amycolatopsis sp. DSM 110486 TaxID=2865832 RepID=UPI001C69FC95|nr:PQQ-binding-like beta-propeller repeat protein [Amycolatopsis sp. DSM 110486]QYN16577.1 PQQ-like beta-propeller repeat protein [Amycolatopsis sp. DSM 110486]